MNHENEHHSLDGRPKYLTITLQYFYTSNGSMLYVLQILLSRDTRDSVATAVALHCITLHHITSYYITLHHITSHYILT